jgi:protein-L-isoaspartate(D-aspartate) O-methyltransferase
MVRDQLEAGTDPRVAAAMLEVPRHWFLPHDLRAGAYDDGARAIGAGQTISQPRMVARMLSALAVQPGDRVLDIGAGSGYAATLLARLAAPGPVLALERQGQLVLQTGPLLAAIAPNITLRHADGLAHADGAFEVIHVAAACTDIPWALRERLAPGGRLLAPVGPHDGSQRLLLITAQGECWLDEVQFVPGLPGLA